MTLRFTILGCGYLGRRAADRTGLGRLQSRKSAQPAPPVLAAGRAPRQDGRTIVLVDTSPDLREQLLDAEAERLDAVLYTHPHADHVHGIDDLRGVFLHLRRRIDVHLDEPTARAVHARFGYCFATPPGSEYPPILTEHRIVAGRPIEVEGPGGRISACRSCRTMATSHRWASGSAIWRIRPTSKTCRKAAWSCLAGLDIWIVDALRYMPHSSHFNVDEALDWIARLKPKRAILTNLHADLDYEELRGKLPPHIEPAYDGMAIELGTGISAPKTPIFMGSYGVVP